jgi:phosphomannomutase
MKRLIVFDLDGTLAESKSQMDNEMSSLLSELLLVKSVAVISGGSFQQFEKQLIAGLKCRAELLKKLFLFPTCSTSFYRYDNRWLKVYSEDLSKHEKERIMNAFTRVLSDICFNPGKIYGSLIEDRGTQVTFSALGQEAPVALKKNWDQNHKKRQEITDLLEKYIPDFEIRMGGTTSIDVTRKGIDKAYGIRQIEKYLGFSKNEMLFIGDALFEGGNDYPVKLAGVEVLEVSGPGDTKRIVMGLIRQSR